MISSRYTYQGEGPAANPEPSLKKYHPEQSGFF